MVNNKKTTNVISLDIIMCSLICGHFIYLKTATVCSHKSVERHKTYTTVLGLASELNLIVVKKPFRGV